MESSNVQIWGSNLRMTRALKYVANVKSGAHARSSYSRRTYPIWVLGSWSSWSWMNLFLLRCGRFHGQYGSFIICISHFFRGNRNNTYLWIIANVSLGTKQKWIFVKWRFCGSCGSIYLQFSSLFIKQGCAFFCSPLYKTYKVLVVKCLWNFDSYLSNRNIQYCEFLLLTYCWIPLPKC